MKPFPGLLAGLLLVLLGAIGWQLLREQDGLLVIQWGAHLVSLRAEVAVLLWLLTTLAVLGLLALIRLPFRAVRRYSQRLARQRLGNGLLALQQGRPERAETLLSLAAQRSGSERVPALLYAIVAAKTAGLAGRLREHRIALSRLDPLASALELASAALEDGRGVEALATLESAAGRGPLPPAGLRLKAEALARLGRADEALPLVARLRSERGHDGPALAALEIRLAVAALADAAEASTLLIRWKGLAPALRAQPPVLLALARRASQLHVEAQAEQALAEAIEARWDEAVVEAWGSLPTFTNDTRLARAEAWLPAHPASPGLLRVLGRLSAATQPARAEAYLHRALAQGAGSAAWEDLGDLLAAAQDPRAALAYANALRQRRGETARELPGRGLRERIGDAATAEERDAFGHPRLPAA